nr:immunoglobulin heavy chain junction region [Macaca mulatta]MOY19991.1 immunoglobulin heavy chain junction region [Macaca mulatta]MOY20457.1 immunoglobulin heavy chain junction region [Macaca mulatta]
CARAFGTLLVYFDFW